MKTGQGNKLHLAGLFATLLALLVATAVLIGLGAYWLIREDARTFASQQAETRVARVFDKMNAVLAPEASAAHIYFALLDGRTAAPANGTGEIVPYKPALDLDPERIYVLYPEDGSAPIWWPFEPSSKIETLGEGLFALNSVSVRIGEADASRSASSDYLGRQRVWPGGKARLLVFEKVDAIGPLHQRVAWLTGATLLALILASSIAVAVAQRRFWTRVNEINEGCEMIAEGGQLGLRVPEKADDALGLIGQNINRMLAEIEERGRLIAMQERFLDHDYRVPITEIVSSCNMLLGGTASSDEELNQGLRRVLELAKRMDAGLAERLELYRFDRDVHQGDYSGMEQLSLREIVDEAVDGNLADAEARNVSVIVNGERDLAINGSRSLVVRALGNLIRNAIQHSEVGGRVEVTINSADGPGVDVRDFGKGMPPERIAEATGSSLRLRSTTNGTGLGLALVRGVMKAHDGSFTITNGSRGLTARVNFVSVPSRAD